MRYALLNGFSFQFITGASLVSTLVLGQSKSAFAMDNALPLHVATGEYTGELWFPDGTSVEAIKKGSNLISVKSANTLLRNRIDKWWPVLVEYFPFSSKAIAYVYFIGEATLESTLNLGVETARRSSRR